MPEPSPLEQQILIADQHTATAGVLLFALAAFGLAWWLFRRRRYPHLAAWVFFVLYAALVAAVPSLRELDQNYPWFYALRGVPLGLLVGSMARFAELTPRQEAPPGRD
ncbi:MAG: hypothetical protein HUU35_03090 [Armatimonadetes bacterium]|nr:hypothetical protein [Armatimonadota bacterium]